MEERTNRPTLIQPTRFERIAGWVYLPIYLFFLSIVLAFIAYQLDINLQSEENQLHINVVYGMINFLFVTVIFRRYLAKSFKCIRQRPGRFCAALFGGYAVYQTGTVAMKILTEFIQPGLENINDASLVSFGKTGIVEMLVYSVILVPVVEECLFRCVIFSTIRKRSRFWAYAISALAFASIHVFGYIGNYPISTLILCYIQYLPAGLVLAWALEFSGSIWASVGIHAISNLLAVVFLIILG